jgi:hypothetical protein
MGDYLGRIEVVETHLKNAADMVEGIHRRLMEVEKCLPKDDGR